MGVSYLSAAYSISVGKSSTKAVLVALAECAGDKTGRAWPSVPELERMTELNRKTVFLCLAELQALKIIVDTGDRVGKTKQITVWWLDLCLLQNKSKCSQESIPKAEQFQKRNSSAFSRKESRFFPESVPKTGHGTTSEPLLNHHHPTSSKNQGVVVDDIDDLVEAAVWEVSRGKNPLLSEGGFRIKKKERLLASGTSAADLKTLLEWREAGRRAAQLAELASAQAQDREKPPVLDKDACARGAAFFTRPGGAQEKIKSSCPVFG